MSEALTLAAAPSTELEGLAADARATSGRPDAGLGLALALGARTPLPGSGGTAQAWAALATVAAADVTTARVLEPHLDALAILDQARAAGHPVSAPEGATWGVYAAEMAGMTLRAVRSEDGAWRLTGDKPWCSLADRLDAALVTAHLPDGGRGLFAVALRDPGVTVLENTWHATGLTAVTSGPVRFAGTPAEPVGPAGWYLRRPGFAWGGIGVAACWWGGAVGVARALRDAAGPAPEPILALHLGLVDAAVETGRLALVDAAERVDAGRAEGADGALLAARTRNVVAAAATTILDHVGRALGPAPLALDATHARRVADLTLYLRQHHGERDEAALGAAVAAEGTAW
jgi:alkylation response protein AidB-like acyl-CoA dehydrogenase